jgi:hypothetical protein
MPGSVLRSRCHTGCSLSLIVHCTVRVRVGRGARAAPVRRHTPRRTHPAPQRPAAASPRRSRARDPRLFRVFGSDRACGGVCASFVVVRGVYAHGRAHGGGSKGRNESRVVSTSNRQSKNSKKSKGSAVGIFSYGNMTDYIVILLRSIE